MSVHVHVPDWLPIDSAPRNRLIEVRGRIDATALTERVYLVGWSRPFQSWITPRGDVIVAIAWRTP